MAAAWHSGCACGHSVPRCVWFVFVALLRAQRCWRTYCIVLSSVRYWHVAGGVVPPQHVRHG